MSGGRQEAQVPVQKEGTEGRKQVRAPYWALRKTEEPRDQSSAFALYGPILAWLDYRSMVSPSLPNSDFLVVLRG